MDAGVTPGQIDSQGRYVPTSAERTAYQAARIPWADQVVYGYYTLAFLCGILALYAILYGLWKLRIRYRYGIRSKAYIKLSAISRLLTYPQLPHRGWVSYIWTFGPLGPNILLGAGLIFATGFTFINEYYYYPPFYGSAPLYLRSEWIAMATLPFVYVLGSKRNLISILTGISHEKLQVLHQGSAFNFTYMSLVHTVAACIRAIRERGMKGTLAVNQVYVSGFVALAPLLVLFAGALPPFRKSFYELFYWIHITMAVFFAGAMFWHGYKTLDSDAYMITTLVLFLSSATTRLILIILNNPTLHSAHVELLDEDTLKITISTIYINWSDSHPFTIANAPPLAQQTQSSDIEKTDRSMATREMIFLLKPLSGFTRTLFNQVQNGQTKYKVLIDGPYGDANVGGDLRGFDKILIVAGGTGITWALSVLQDLVGNREGRGGMGREVVLVWAVKRISSMKWFENELQAIRTHHPNVSIEHYITEESIDDFSRPSPPESGPSSADGHGEDDTPSTEKGLQLSIKAKADCHRGRPDLPYLIERTVASTHGFLAVATCGPPAFLTDCANAVTKAQIGILTDPHG
uniref:FAD-binding FR-type domain-containing protein n=1 Tax=Kwoniella bestiolae CBS 10118 TaxID=1296100 RepID=A0A1B9FV84_9TREE|nr:hypothetical protein I302_08319 [Kwoniella bestiolae CBS 10118]OCF22668.1 hypothetical protein I302_08319 [Kwoniella bestiolae CBS 10118]